MGVVTGADWHCTRRHDLTASLLNAILSSGIVYKLDFCRFSGAARRYEKVWDLKNATLNLYHNGKWLGGNFRFLCMLSTATAVAGVGFSQRLCLFYRVFIWLLHSFINCSVFTIYICSILLSRYIFRCLYFEKGHVGIAEIRPFLSIWNNGHPQSRN